MLLNKLAKIGLNSSILKFFLSFKNLSTSKNVSSFFLIAISGEDNLYH